MIACDKHHVQYTEFYDQFARQKILRMHEYASLFRMS